MKTLSALSILLASQAAMLADTKVVLPDYERFAQGDKEFHVTSTIPGDFTTAEGIVAALLILGDQVANRKLTASFSPQAISSTSSGKDALPLAACYRGARIEKDSIIVAFSGEAMRYLNSTVSIQALVKGSIERTLRLHFPSVKTIEYEIDGKIVSDWDA